jgi:hypothetical protein
VIPETDDPFFQNIPAQDRHRKAVPKGFQVPGMVVAETSGKAVGLAETAVRDMLKKHIVDVALRTVGNDTTEGAAGFFAGLFQFKKIDVFIYRHASYFLTSTAASLRPM